MSWSIESVREAELAPSEIFALYMDMRRIPSPSPSD
jgi:hypothetical protein